MTASPHILLIDDDAGARARVAKALAGPVSAITLVEAADAAAALAAARRESFACVLLGQLSGVDAAEFLKLLTSAEGGWQAVVVLSADDENALNLLRAGALESLSRGEASPQDLARAIRFAPSRRAYVHELRAARDDAEAKSLALDRVNRQTRLILSVIAHDLRNPFQVLLGMSQLLSETAKAGADPQALSRRADGVNEAATQAYGLLESLFAWASLQMDARAERVALDVDALLRDCAAAMQQPADDKGVRLEIRPAGLNAHAQGDAAVAILRNLVANAIKFTPAGGAVTLFAERRGHFVAICVADTGVGMSAAKAARLFQLDGHDSATGTAGERGAGLGLLLCRDLAEWIGGTLEVESEPDQGATFRLLIAAA